MPNFSGVWNLKEQIQAIAAGRWTGLPLPGLFSWGQGTSGALGLGVVVAASSPTQVGALTDWDSVSAGFRHAAAINEAGQLYIWGLNSQGQLGLGDTINRSSPVQVGALTNWTQVSAGGNASFSQCAAVKTDNTLWSWGSNFRGQLGQNIFYLTSRSSPVQIGALSDWAQVSMGGTNCFAVKTNSTLWAWGYQLVVPDGVLASRSSPVQIGALTNWAHVVGGAGSHAAAVKTNGTLFTWGGNGSGGLGDGTTTTRLSPVQVGALTNWAQVAVGNQNFSVAVKTDGTLWSWGYNNRGQLGDGTVVNKSSPIQVGADTDWATVYSDGQTLSIKTDDTLYAWGRNNNGGIGDGTTADRSSPVQIGADKWSSVSAGTNVSLGLTQGFTP